MIQKMVNFDDVTKEKIKEHIPNWLELSDHPYRISITGDSPFVKSIPLFNLINQQGDIYKIYIYAKRPYEAKYKLLINERRSTG